MAYRVPYRTVRDADVAGYVVSPGRIRAVGREVIDNYRVIGAVVILNHLTRGSIVVAPKIDRVLNDNNGIPGVQRGPLEGNGIPVDGIVGGA